MLLNRARSVVIEVTIRPTFMALTAHHLVKLYTPETLYHIVSRPGQGDIQILNVRSFGLAPPVKTKIAVRMVVTVRDDQILLQKAYLLLNTLPLLSFTKVLEWALNFNIVIEEVLVILGWVITEHAGLQGTERLVVQPERVLSNLAAAETYQASVSRLQNLKCVREGDLSSYIQVLHPNRCKIDV